MQLSISTPRLLPMTILAMAALLAVKSVTLVRAAIPAGAAATAPPTSPPPTSPAPASPAPGRPGEPSASAAGAPAAAHTPVVNTGPSVKPIPAGHVAPEPSTPHGAEPAPAGRTTPIESPPVSDSERTLLLDLRARRSELEARDAQLQTREQVLGAAEHRLATRIDELTALQKRLEALETSRKARDDVNWRGLVKLYETMKPRDAAVIFNDLDLPVLLQVVDRMKEAKAAAVLAAMLPERARQVTAELAQMRGRANSINGAGDAKGG